jgi:tetratricopeptide (TPR) repeat protein
MARSNHKTPAVLVSVAALILLSAVWRPACAAESSPAGAAAADWSLPANQAEKLGPELAGKVAQWDALTPEDRMKVLLQCMGILGDGADALCLKVLRYESTPALLRRASLWFIDNGRKEHVSALMEIAGARKEPAIVFVAATLAAQYGETDKATALLEQAQTGDTSVALLLAGLYEKRGDFKKAEAGYKALADLEPANIRFIAKYAEMLVRNGDRPKALEALQEIPLGHEDSVEANLDYVGALHDLGFAEEAVAAATDAARKFKDYRFPYLLAGFARDAGDRDGAMKHYFDALEMASREPELRLLVAESGELILESADFDKEFADLRNSASRAEIDANYRSAVWLNLLIARVAAEKGKAPDAVAACQAVWDDGDRAAIIFDDLPALLGGMLGRAGAWEKAAEIYKAAIDSGERKQEYYVARGRCYLKAGKPEDAVKAWGALIEGEGAMDPQRHLALVDALLANGMAQEAERASWEAVGRFPAEIEIVLQRLKILMGNGRANEAAQLITETLKRVEPAHQAEAAYAIVMALPQDANLQELVDSALAANAGTERKLAEALLERAEALEADGKKEEAVALCRKILALAPNETVAAKAREIMSRLGISNTGEADRND